MREAEVYIESPTLRTASNSDWMNDVAYGGGHASAPSFISTEGDTAVYAGLPFVSIVCTVAGPFVAEEEQLQQPVFDLDCPPSVTRGGSNQATLDASGATNQNWSFSSGGGGTAGKTGDNTWSGTMAVSGTITVTFNMGQFTGLVDSCNVTVNERSWSTTPASPQQTTSTLSRPPQVADDLGQSQAALSPATRRRMMRSTI